MLFSPFVLYYTEKIHRSIQWKAITNQFLFAMVIGPCLVLLSYRQPDIEGSVILAECIHRRSFLLFANVHVFIDFKSKTSVMVQRWVAWDRTMALFCTTAIAVALSSFANLFQPDYVYRNLRYASSAGSRTNE